MVKIQSADVGGKGSSTNPQISIFALILQSQVNTLKSLTPPLCQDTQEVCWNFSTRCSCQVFRESTDAITAKNEVSFESEVMGAYRIVQRKVLEYNLKYWGAGKSDPCTQSAI